MVSHFWKTMSANQHEIFSKHNLTVLGKYFDMCSYPFPCIFSRKRHNIFYTNWNSLVSCVWQVIIGCKTKTLNKTLCRKLPIEIHILKTVLIFLIRKYLMLRSPRANFWFFLAVCPRARARHFDLSLVSSVAHARARTQNKKKFKLLFPWVLVG